jgi:hypothetical protein
MPVNGAGRPPSAGRSAGASRVTDGENVSKKEIKAAIQETAQQIAALEAKHPTQEMRPWVWVPCSVALSDSEKVSPADALRIGR